MAEEKIKQLIENLKIAIDGEKKQKEAVKGLKKVEEYLEYRDKYHPENRFTKINTNI